MKEIYKEAFSEVDEIFGLMPRGLLNKIPNEFKQIIKTEKSKDYTPHIQEPMENYSLKEETIIVLALIYRDFLCSKEEKEELKLRDAQKIKEAEDELREKYNPDNLFKNRKVEEQNTESITTQETAIVEYKERNFIQKIFEKIKHLFRKS